MPYATFSEEFLRDSTKFHADHSNYNSLKLA
uniref:Uncharacterized protein n=1 Tax=Arundo donax TaxID=35708 RepID=A0A0A9APH9_ARUDO